jgi:hypothetical protein
MDLRQTCAQGMTAEAARILTVEIDVAAREEGYS